MEAIEKSINFLQKLQIGKFPKGHLIALFALSLSLIGFTLLPSEHASAKRSSQPVAIPLAIEEDDLPLFVQKQYDEKMHNTITTDTSVQQQAEFAEFRTIKETVKPGDNLSLIFKHAGLSDRQMMLLLGGHPESKRLKSLFPGHTLEFLINKQDELQSLTYTKSRLSSFIFSKHDDIYSFQEINRNPDIKVIQRSAVINHSLYLAGQGANLDDSLIMELADIFGWDIDFALDIRQGDQFKIVFEEEFLDGEKIANGNILAAEFINQNETFRAIRYVDSSGDVSYYTPEGESMRKAFLRAPLDFRRISDNFNPNRLHPVFKTVRAHRGTDYAANRGTPVWASGAGKVIASAYSSANGNYVVIQHGNNIQTKYLHLQKRHVKKGQKVKQKEKIGLVGSTGYATGPHLHYEFLISGVHRNPRTIVNKLPKAKSIGHVEMAQFLLQTTPIVAQLDAQDSATQYATAEQEESMKNKRL